MSPVLTNRVKKQCKDVLGASLEKLANTQNALWAISKGVKYDKGKAR